MFLLGDVTTLFSPRPPTIVTLYSFMISSPSVTIFVKLLYARQMHCLHARMYSHMSAYMRTHTHKRAGCMHACVHTRTHALVHTCTQHAMFMCACIPYTHVWTRAHTRARFRLSTCTHEPIYTSTHIHARRT